MRFDEFIKDDLATARRGFEFAGATWADAARRRRALCGDPERFAVPEE